MEEMLAQQERVTQRKGFNYRIFSKYQIKWEKKSAVQPMKYSCMLFLCLEHWKQGFKTQLLQIPLHSQGMT